MLSVVATDSDTRLRTADGRRVKALRGARTAQGRRVDVAIAGGRVAAITDSQDTSVGTDELDLDGYLLLESGAEPHAHLDKALSWSAIRPPMGDLASAIASWHEYSADITSESIAERARQAAQALLANGTTAVRSHIDLLRGPDPLRGVRALTKVREELSSVMDVQLVAMAPYDLPGDVIDAALDLGVDFVGGSPHHTPQPSADLQRLLRVAERRQVGVDIHIDEQLDPAILTLEELATSVREWPESMPVTAGHCVSLGTVERDVRARVIAEVVASRVGVVALPITNLYLQGWDHAVSTPRGLTAVRALLDAGARLAAGADNVRDPFNPLGRSDALETAMLLVTAGHLTTTEAYHAVSTGAREVMSLPTAGAEVGAQADLLAIRATDLEDAIANASADRYVLRRGRLVAATQVRQSVHTG